MLKEGKYCDILDNDGNALCVFTVYSDKSHNLKIVSKDFKTGDLKGIELHSGGEVGNLYKFLKVHFEDEKWQRFPHTEYLEYVAALKDESCPIEDIASEEEWRAELEKEFREAKKG